MNVCVKFKVDCLRRFCTESRHMHSTQTLFLIEIPPTRKLQNQIPLSSLSDQVTICQIFFQYISVASPENNFLENTSAWLSLKHNCGDLLILVATLKSNEVLWNAFSKSFYLFISKSNHAFIFNVTLWQKVDVHWQRTDLIRSFFFGNLIRKVWFL